MPFSMDCLTKTCDIPFLALRLYNIKMPGTMRVRFRVEYKGENDDVDIPAPLSVEMDEGSTIIDLLENAARFHQE